MNCLCVGGIDNEWQAVRKKYVLWTVAFHLWQNLTVTKGIEFPSEHMRAHMRAVCPSETLLRSYCRHNENSCWESCKDISTNEVEMLSTFMHNPWECLLCAHQCSSQQEKERWTMQSTKRQTEGWCNTHKKIHTSMLQNQSTFLHILLNAIVMK